MSKRLYVGNLSTQTTEESLMRAFAAWAPASVTVPTGGGGRSKGIGFIEIPQDDQAALAIAAMDGKQLDGRALLVGEARLPRPDSRATEPIDAA